VTSPARLKGYYFITDKTLSIHGNEADVRSAAAAGVRIIQYREKNASSRRLLEEARALKKLCAGSLFIVNDRLDIALAVEADGVHLGNDDLPPAVARRLLGPDKIIGVSVRTLEEAAAARENGADYLGVAPVFPTATKADAGAACGPAVIARIKNEIGLPVAAIGGITLANAPEVIAAGADMICAISAVVAAAEPSAAMRRFEELFP
jgi:thiamine-phosphate pyrophosphorylase